MGRGGECDPAVYRNDFLTGVGVPSLPVLSFKPPYRESPSALGEGLASPGGGTQGKSPCGQQ